jgi:hypothetical protein
MNNIIEPVTPGNGCPSGLAMMSPWTFTNMWVRYAEMEPFDCVLATPGTTVTKTWATSAFLIRASPDNIYRGHNDFQRSITAVSGQVVVAKYNDDLDFVTAITSTSDGAAFGIPDQFPFGTSSIVKIEDIWHDPINDEFWVSNDRQVGIDMWKFDGNFKYINKYGFNFPSGIFGARGVFINGQHFFYNGTFSTSGPDIIGSGIYPVHILSEGTEPFSGDATLPGIGEGYIDPNEGKFINGAPFVGIANFGEILHIINVPSSTHLTPGVWALVRWQFSGGSQGNIYLVRIEETATNWEIRSFAVMTVGLPAPFRRRHILYMDY